MLYICVHMCVCLYIHIIFSSEILKWKKKKYPLCIHTHTHTRIYIHMLLFCCLVAKSCPDLLRPHAHQAPLSMGFSRQEYWNGLPLEWVFAGIFLMPGSNLGLLHWHVYSLPMNHQESPMCMCVRIAHTYMLYLLLPS